MAIIQDIKRYANGSIMKGIFNILFEPCLHAVFCYRFGSWIHKKLHFQFLPRLLQIHSRIFYGIDIDFRASLGPGLYIVHGSGVVIGCSTIAGKNLSVHQGVTIGGSNEKKRTIMDNQTIEQPFIGDNVSINTGAIVLGPVIIGSGATIGSRALIMKDIPSNSIVYSKNELVIR